MDIQPKTPDLSVDEMTVVLVGDFNPKIFHPMWFANHGVLREAEATEARIEVVHSDVCSFSTEWLTVQVLRDRFTAAIKADVYQAHLGDLVANVFTLLSHSPVHQMGLNTTFRLHFKSEDDWHSFGHLILPKSPWSGVLEKPGLRSVMVQGSRGDKHLGYLSVTLEPDLRQRGDALLRINDHFEAPQAKDGHPTSINDAQWALAILKEDFQTSSQRARGLAAQLMKNFMATEAVDAGG
jgi:hypothetical protein